MAAMTDKLENVLIDWLFRGQAANVSGYMTNASAAAGTGPTNLYVALFTVTPTDTGGGTEVTGTDYLRATVASSLNNWAGTQSTGSTAVSTGTSGTTSNNNAITFPTPGSGGWGTITGFGIFDASTAGNMLIWGALTANKTVNYGDAAPSFAAAALSFQIDN